MLFCFCEAGTLESSSIPCLQILHLNFAKLKMPISILLPYTSQTSVTSLQGGRRIHRIHRIHECVQTKGSLLIKHWFWCLYFILLCFHPDVLLCRLEESPQGYSKVSFCSLAVGKESSQIFQLLFNMVFSFSCEI